MTPFPRTGIDYYVFPVGKRIDYIYVSIIIYRLQRSNYLNFKNILYFSYFLYRTLVILIFSS
jgi:hypothetical protein